METAAGGLRGSTSGDEMNLILSLRSSWFSAAGNFDRETKIVVSILDEVTREICFTFVDLSLNARAQLRLLSSMGVDHKVLWPNEGAHGGGGGQDRTISKRPWASAGVLQCESILVVVCDT